MEPLDSSEKLVLRHKSCAVTLKVRDSVITKMRTIYKVQGVSFKNPAAIVTLKWIKSAGNYENQILNA